MIKVVYILYNCKCSRQYSERKFSFGNAIETDRMAINNMQESVSFEDKERGGGGEGLIF
jgi:hypothetical protein